SARNAGSRARYSSAGKRSPRCQRWYWSARTRARRSSPRSESIPASALSKIAPGEETAASRSSTVKGNSPFGAECMGYPIVVLASLMTRRSKPNPPSSQACLVKIQQLPQPVDHALVALADRFRGAADKACDLRPAVVFAAQIVDAALRFGHRLAGPLQQ